MCKTPINYKELLEIAKENHTYKNKNVLIECKNKLFDWCERFVNNQSPQTICNIALKDFRTKDFTFPGLMYPTNVHDFCHLIIRLALQNDLHEYIDGQLNAKGVLEIPMQFNANLGIEQYPCILSMSYVALDRIKKSLREVRNVTGDLLSNIELDQEANNDIQFNLDPKNSHIKYSKLKYIIGTLGTLTVVLDFEEGLQLRSIIDLNKLGV